MEAFLYDLPKIMMGIIGLVGLIVSAWVLSSIISVAQTSKLLLAEQQKTNAILSAVHGLDGANARCPACSARITVDPARMGHSARCQACGKVVKAEPLQKTA